MKKKLLITASTMPRWKRDTEPRFILDLAEALSLYFDVTVLAPAAPGAKKHEKMGNVEVVRYHYFPIHKWETLCYPGSIVGRIKQKKIRALLVPFLLISLYVHLLKYGKKYDVVHANWMIPQGIIQGLLKTPYMLTGHGSDVRSLNIGPIKSLKKRCLRNASVVTVVSNALKQDMMALYPRGDINVIPMGCNTEFFSPIYRKENYFQQKGKKVVLFVGRLDKQKGIVYLIRAMQTVDAVLIIVGDGPEKSMLKSEAKTLGLLDKVIFLGAKSHAELRYIYSSADVFAAPSVTADNGGQEGFGLVIVEAMASGLPVIASNSGGIVDIILDGEQGFLVSEKDVSVLAKRINRILNDESLRRDMSSKALSRAKEFSYKVVGKKYSELLEAIERE